MERDMEEINYFGPFMDIELRKYLDDRRRELNYRLDNLTDEELTESTVGTIMENLYKEYCVEEVVIGNEVAENRKIEREKIHRLKPGYKCTYWDEACLVFTFCYSYTGNIDLFRSKASTFYTSYFYKIAIDEGGCLYFQIEKPIVDWENNQGEVYKDVMEEKERALEFIKSGISFANNDVDGYNKFIKCHIEERIKQHKVEVNILAEVRKVFEIPLQKTEFATKYVELEKRQALKPEVKNVDKGNEYCISDSDYEEIVSILKHTASTYERTPYSYRSLQEEDLRNTLLAALNGRYVGQANGETFRNNGKTDICIEWENRAAFIAECKMWNGVKGIHDALKQLDGYRTWRDNKTALIYFSRNKEFQKVLENSKKYLCNEPLISNFKEKDKNEYEFYMESISNSGQTIRVRFMVFNLYVDR